VFAPLAPVRAIHPPDGPPGFLSKFKEQKGGRITCTLPRPDICSDNLFPLSEILTAFDFHFHLFSYLLSINQSIKSIKFISQ